MSLRSVVLEEVAEEHLLGLVEDEVAERRVIEYKRELPGASDAAKKEFLADVCSFANSSSFSGGDIVYGVDEEGGVPVAVPGLKIGNVDAEINRLESSIRDGIEPRVEGVGSHPVALNGGTRAALVVRVPRSAVGPHVVTYQNHWKFYSRATTGKFQMNYEQVRRAFLSSGSFIEGVKRYRDRRLGTIRSGEAPTEVGGPALVVLHPVPLSALDSPAPTFELELGRPPLNYGLLSPILSVNNTPRYNFDGLVCEAPYLDGRPVGYVQLFGTGAIEAVDRSSFGEGEMGPFIKSEYLERSLIDAAARYLELQRGIGVEPPVLLLLSVVGAGGYHLAVPTPLSFDARPVDRDELKIGPATIEDLKQDRDTGVAQLMRPLLDGIWNACGFPRSPNFDGHGRRVPHAPGVW